jgi:hypothetical protein
MDALISDVNERVAVTVVQAEGHDPVVLLVETKEQVFIRKSCY